MLLKRIQLGLIHVAVTITLVPIDATLNRVMIKELAISATVFAVLSSLAYLLSPIQVLIGSYSDRHPIFGFRRTPYIVVGVFLCALSLVLLPPVAFLMTRNFPLGFVAGIFAFGAWGMGYNLSAVCYLSLATELSGEDGRGRTIATMWFMMIVGIIVTAATVGHLVDPYTPAALSRAFYYVAASAVILGMLGLIGLEPRSAQREGLSPHSESYTVKEMFAAITSNPVARVFFIYLFLLLVGILGQNILLEPFAGQAFGMSVGESTSVNSVWGTFVLIALIIAGALDRRVAKKVTAQIGNIGALIGFVIIVVSGAIASRDIFYVGITLLGFGTGLCTVANLSLMFDLTVPGLVGLYIGAWGFSNALSRLVGNLLGGVIVDALKASTGNALLGYLTVFSIEALMLFAAALMLSRIDVEKFKRAANEPSFGEKLALT